MMHKHLFCSRLFVAIAIASCGWGGVALATGPDRYLVRPQFAGPHDEIFVPVSLPDCGLRFRHDPATFSMEVSPGEAPWIRSTVHLVLELEPVTGGPCISWEPYQEPVVAARIGRLPLGTHWIHVEVRRFAPGSDMPLSTETRSQGVTVLDHPRFESGFWYEAARPGHGVSLIVRSGQARETYDEGDAFSGASLPQSLYLSWQTYDADGQQMWLTGAASDAAVQPLVVEVFQHDGMRYPALDPAGLQTRRWGTATMEPDGCGRLRVVWRPDGPSLSARVTLFERLVGTEELSYCDPHPTWWTILPVQEG